MTKPHSDPGVASPQPPQEVSRPATQVGSRLTWEQIHGASAMAPVTYDKTSALILGWAENADDTKTAQELVPLQNTFQESYGFPVQYNRMHMRKDPQVQATKHVADFVYEHDAPKGLLIIYYAGHGWAEENSIGRISLSGKFPHGTDEKDKSIDWIQVEYALRKTKSDVLVIFDCCHAGLLCRPAFRGPRRSFYYVGACKEDQTTMSSGIGSFTSAMIWALRKLAGSPRFTVTTLISTLMDYEHFPIDDQQPVIDTSRFGPGDQEIWITPARREETRDVQLAMEDIAPKLPPTADVLDLRFHFAHYAKSSHIQHTAIVLKEFLDTNKSLHFHRISFIDHVSLVEWSARHWMERTRTRRSFGKDAAASPVQSPNVGSYENPSRAVGRHHLGLPTLQIGKTIPLSPASSTAVASPACDDPPWKKGVGETSRNMHASGGVLHHLGLALHLFIEGYLPAFIGVILYRLFERIETKFPWAKMVYSRNSNMRS